MKLAPSPALLRPNGFSHSSVTASVLHTPAAEPESFHFQTVAWQADGFGFDATSGEFFTASPTALAVMQGLSQGLLRHQILDRITSTFEVSRSTAERDLESFLAELAHIGLVRESN